METCIWIIHFNDVISFHPYSVAHGGPGSSSGFVFRSVMRTLNLWPSFSFLYVESPGKFPNGTNYRRHSLDSENSCTHTLCLFFFPPALVRLWGEDNLHFTQGELDAVEVFHSSRKNNLHITPLNMVFKCKGFLFPTLPVIAVLVAECWREK